MNESSVLQDLFEPNEEKSHDDVPALGLPIYDMGDLGDLALLKAALDGEQEMAIDEAEAEASEMPLDDSRDPTPDFTIQIDSDTDTSSSEMQVDVAPATRIEVAIPELSAERRIEYSAVHSMVVERLAACREYRNDYIEYDLEFTDGRIQTVRLEQSVYPHLEYRSRILRATVPLG
ncbi:uncharacterized protein TrAtP1_003336 [Trichoderma atroviride]|uniref:uncharacterized protein n=1 Tax=Hypocrea atroviridis TaxID=63577 RepID=UPI00332A322C|nr:hypothetical protein TrAtP1_003336 [Trichoderma atroviride]